MIIQQFFVPGIAHSSYIVAGNRKCAVIDPCRDVGPYIEYASQNGLQITHILETHLHADFISGHLDLAELTGATIYAPKSGKCAFPHKAVAEGDEILVEDIRFSVIDTAGHTPEHICYIAADLGRGESPVALFSGDTLFVGDVGRPDLFPGQSVELASSLYENLHTKIMTLPDEVEVYPAHGMGSLCGRAMAAKRTSTIGYEKKYNYALNIATKEEFIHALTSDMPAAPDHFARCSEINRTGPALMRTLDQPGPVDPKPFLEKIQSGALLLDTRSYPAFSGLHIPDAWHIDLSGNFATQAGWVLPPEREILLVVEEKRQAEEAALQLRRVGFDRISGFLSGGMLAWGTAALPVSRVPVLSPEEADAEVKSGTATLIDVRSQEEWDAAHAEKSIHIPWHDLRIRYEELDAEGSYIVMCRGGQRASIAASILKMKQIERVANLGGGYTAYSRAGFAP
ncbi:MAG: MBL fold metallo-hydrolase [Methanocalculus sp. MSAO_Arc1]|uniref:MBL fold metallo-hydrolase n=1 Tax=Methanocalculus TaxID=71151 RepID=UPI000FF259E1|nr:MULTISPECIES: MBL fold metallo-hydrolase [unclassified Methanocalculus]MCP1662893.1 glyoxylase-like metal-dependent hydrolase (beta-lactamase superfamily II)/rhodanese-related sulfurtransferase [Methanocalculus sp. AMF5]RQD80041.1 MAG: MBL fold metallo-hydrolase [Methanocalculus sp. MSAO_Arc1]